MSGVSNNIVYLHCNSNEMIINTSNNNKKSTTMENAITTSCKAMSNIAIVNSMTAVRAKVIARRTNSIDNGIVKAAMINELKTKLANGIARFLFVKKNGELRMMYATTSPNFVKTKINGRGESRENYATCAVWDIEAGSWKSFRWETLVQVF